MISFFVPGPPVAKGRARSTRSGQHYTPVRTRQYENRIATAARDAMRGCDLYSGAVELEVVLLMPIPKSWPRLKQAMAEIGELAHTTRPDVDNVVKSVKDGCNGAVWVDDSQVVMLTARKRYGITPGAHVTVRGVGE